MKRKFRKINLEYVLLAVILLFGFFLRIYRLGVPPFWIDESISTIASLNILEKGIPLFDSGLLYSRAYLFHYVQAFFLLFGNTDFLARFPSVIFGLLTIVLAYFIGKEYSKSGGIISALFMSVFYLEVFFSRQARFYQLFQLMFFLSIYLLYKSKDNSKWLYLSLISFFITINIQIAGLVLAPFFVLHIIIYSTKWRKYFSILPGLSLFYKILPTHQYSSDSTISAISYFRKYAAHTSNIVYLLILFIPGIIWGFVKRKRLTFLLVAPSIILLVGVFALKTFALRYAYFFVFPLVLYSSLLISFLYEKYGKIILIAIFLMLIIPSNLFFPHTYVTMIKPIDYNYNDYSAPEINLKEIPLSLMNNLKSDNLLSLFSPSIERYVKKPDYVFPFSMTGIGNDTISYKDVDIYSGAQIITKRPSGKYYVTGDYYSLNKLKPFQRENFNKIIEGCSVSYENKDLKIYWCK
ncbi:MAG: glycosyltransferase family 39 protein [Candidatus Pacearchaeota archaeon]